LHHFREKQVLLGHEVLKVLRDREVKQGPQVQLALKVFL
jgi:hypothetical protein